MNKQNIYAMTPTELIEFRNRQECERAVIFAERMSSGDIIIICETLEERATSCGDPIEEQRLRELSFKVKSIA